MDKDEIWTATLGELEVTFSKPNFLTWFRETFLVELLEDRAIIGVPNSFTREWLEKKYNLEITRTLKKFAPQIKEITYKITSRTNTLTPLSPGPAIVEPATRHNGFNPRYTFDSFIVGASNRLAHASSKAVAARPGDAYNPLFIYGGVGLGKTHLIQAIGQAILENLPNKKVVYVSCERFTNDFVAAIQSGEMRQFKHRYRNIDVLLVDDIQFLANKEGTQEEFFHTYNELHQGNRQIVITSDRPPKAIPGMAGRLSSRLGGGLVVDIQLPNLETRLVILQAKAKERGYSLSDDVLGYIAQNIQTNIRELEGALLRVVTYCQLNNLEPSVDIASQILETIIASGLNRNLSVDKVMKIVAGFFSLPTQELLSQRRHKELVYPRQILMYLLRHEMGFSYPKIGKELGKKDHTTIIHGCKKIERELPRNNSLQQELAMIKEKLYLA